MWHHVGHSVALLCQVEVAPGADFQSSKPFWKKSSKTLGLGDGKPIGWEREATSRDPAGTEQGCQDDAMVVFDGSEILTHSFMIL